SHSPGARAPCCWSSSCACWRSACFCRGCLSMRFRMKSAAVCCWPLAALLLGPRIAQAAALADFQLSATEQNFALYFPTYLAHGFFSAQSSLRGTDATLAQMVGLMDYTPGDVSRPAAIPSWTEIDYFDGAAWLN